MSENIATWNSSYIEMQNGAATGALKVNEPVVTSTSIRVC